jgi:hypothetical protein
LLENGGFDRPFVVEWGDTDGVSTAAVSGTIGPGPLQPKMNQNAAFGRVLDRGFG